LTRAFFFFKDNKKIALFVKKMKSRENSFSLLYVFVF